MIGAVWKLIIFTSTVNRLTDTSRNERVEPYLLRLKGRYYEEVSAPRTFDFSRLSSDDWLARVKGKIGERVLRAFVLG
jgi:hypothetical protein